MSGITRRIQGLLIASTTALLVLTGLAMPQPARADEYTIAIEPFYPPQRVQEIYKPFTDYLGRSTGHKFKIITSRNYHFFWRDLRNNTAADFSFEEAPFVEYRMLRQNFVPLARVAEDSSYSLIAQPDYAERGLDGLVGYRVVCMPSPSMGFDLLNRMYTNPLSQPEVKSEAASWRDAVEIVFAGEGEAAMVPRHIAELYPNLVEVATSKSYPGTTVSASSNVPEDVRNAVRDALLKLNEEESMFDVLTEIGASRFVEASDSDYKGAEDMLKSSFGYKPPSASEPPPPAAEDEGGDENPG